MIDTGPSGHGGRTRGQPAAVEAARAIVGTGRTHAILLAGPAGAGKTTLALDLAATLLCTAEPSDHRPCRTCRACRMVDGGNHPDLHRLGPEGPGGQIRIGERSNPDPGTVRGLLAALSLLPVEGGARVAIVEQAHRMNDDAQSALLKTLEEPPSGAIFILCADDEERLLPTIRSRCARVRLGPVGTRDVEALLAERGLADPPTAAQVARISHGLPGIAIGWAGSPEAVLTRREIARGLLDLLGAPRHRRLAAARELLGAAAELGLRLAANPSPAGSARTNGRRRRASPSSQSDGPDAAPVGDAETDAPAEPEARRPPSERRRAAAILVEIWRAVARDLALVQVGDVRLVRDQSLLDDLSAASAGLATGAAAAFLARLTRAGELLEGNVGPELVVDALVLAWPRSRPAA